MHKVMIGWHSLSANVSRVVVKPTADAKLVSRLLDGLAEHNAQPRVMT